MDDKAIQEEHIILHEIINSLVVGQFKQARDQTLYKIKTKPDRVAYRVGGVISHLYTYIHRGPKYIQPYLESFK